MSLTAIIHTQLKDITTWDTPFLNAILSAGNNLYTYVSNSIKKDLLLLTDISEFISVLIIKFIIYKYMVTHLLVMYL